MGLSKLISTEYPGRLILIGKSLNRDVVVCYFISGRSPSSQARRLVKNDKEQKIYVEPTDEKVLKQGDPELLIYPAIMIGNGIAVSNGKQSRDMKYNFAENENELLALVNSLDGWEYEPDGPIYTPRISGCIFDNAYLSIIKKQEVNIHQYFQIPLIKGKGKWIATYDGVNKNPVPSFSGEPRDIALPFNSAEETGKAIYDSLSPENGKPDLRVSLACVFKSNVSGDLSIYIKNRYDEETN